MPNLRFDQNPPQQLFSDFEKLNALQDEQFDELSEIVLSFISGETQSDLKDTIVSFSENHNINQMVLKTLTQGLLFFFKGAIRNNLSPLFVKEDLQTLGLAEEKSIRVASKWKQSFIAISRSTVANTLMVNQLVDMEWKFGITAANSEVGKVGSAFLQLKLVLDKGNGKTEDVIMELSLQQFYEFYSEMQKAKANLEYFTY
mmetsp:Transcript_17512/g.24300  ORF Transcript_17512/g.24300 Transcript_17512/m.24300 type:complete len:201 (-) Transcript_17512:1717-2319(-)